MLIAMAMELSFSALTATMAPPSMLKREVASPNAVRFKTESENNLQGRRRRRKKIGFAELINFLNVKLITRLDQFCPSHADIE
jgi:hypothetical protein